MNGMPKEDEAKQKRSKYNKHFERNSVKPEELAESVPPAPAGKRRFKKFSVGNVYNPCNGSPILTVRINILDQSNP